MNLVRTLLFILILLLIAGCGSSPELPIINSTNQTNTTNITYENTNDSINLSNELLVQDLEHDIMSEYDAVKQNEPNLCYDLWEGHIYGCLLEFALVYERLDICEEILTKIGYSPYDCYVELALKNNAPILCEELDRINPQGITGTTDHCYQDYAITTNQSEFCGEIDNYSFYCYFHVANNTLNYSACKDIPNPTMKEKCYAEIAKTISNPKICNMQNRWFWKYCYFEVALKMDSIEICDGLNDRLDRNYCYNVFESTKYEDSDRSYDICLNIPESQKESCYTHYVSDRMYREPLEACEDLKNQKNKEECLENSQIVNYEDLFKKHD